MQEPINWKGVFFSTLIWGMIVTPLFLLEVSLLQFWFPHWKDGPPFFGLNFLILFMHSALVASYFDFRISSLLSPQSIRPELPENTEGDTSAVALPQKQGI